MAGISRVNGNAAAGSFYGYQPLFVKVTNTADDIGTANSGGGTTAITEGNFEKALRGIQTIASIVVIGERTDNGFIVALDGATAQPTGPAYDTDGTPTVTERLVAVIQAATGKSDVSVAAVTLAVSSTGVIS